MRWVQQYVVAAVVFGALDALWLGVVAQPLYDATLGPLLAPHPVWWAALLFYALYLVGVLHFVVGPALAAGSVRRALRDGALLGLVAYGTWALTNLAVLRDFPVVSVPIDLLWGAVLTGTTGAVTVAVLRGRVSPPAPGPASPRSTGRG